MILRQLVRPRVAIPIAAAVILITSQASMASASPHHHKTVADLRAATAKYRSLFGRRRHRFSRALANWLGRSLMAAGRTASAR